MQDIYTINQIEYNTVNSNRYVYIDSYDGNVRLENNKWRFDLNFYIIHNSILPTNFFLFDLSTSFFQIDSIQMNEIKNTTIPYFVTQKNLCSVYTTTIYADIPNQLINQQVNLYNVLLNAHLYVNTSILDVVDIRSDVNEINNFISECGAQNVNASFEYNNSYEINNKETASIQMCTDVYINSKTGSFYKNGTVGYKNLVNQDDAITNYCELNFDSGVTIKKIMTSFLYCVDEEMQEYSYEFEDDVWEWTDERYTIAFKQKTFFNIEDNKLSKSNNGVTGIYIPVNATGELTCNVEVLDEMNNLRFFTIKQDVIFSNNLDKNNKISVVDGDFKVDEEFASDKYYD